MKRSNRSRGAVAINCGSAPQFSHVSLNTLQNFTVFLTLFQQPRDVQFTIGVGEGPDLSFTDINGQENFAGPGINAAARAMGGAQPNEILVTEAVYESLKNFSSYYGRFESVIREVKGVSWRFYRKVASDQSRSLAFGKKVSIK